MTIELVSPYKPNINKARILIREYADVKLSSLYIPALASELQSLKHSLDSSDRTFNEDLSNVASILNDTQIRPYLKILKENDDNSIKLELRKNLQDVKTNLEELARRMTAALDGFETVTLTDNSGEIATLESERIKLLSNLPADQKELSGKRGQYETLEKAIIEFESKTFIDRGQPIFDEVKTAVTSAVNSPSKKATIAVESGLNVAQKVLNILNDQLKYNHLVEARDTLAGEISIRQSQMHDEQKKVNESDDKKSALTAIQDIFEPRELYVAEARKIIGMLTGLINEVFSPYDINSTDGMISIGDKFLENLPDVPRHIDAIAFYWLRRTN